MISWTPFALQGPAQVTVPLHACRANWPLCPQWLPGALHHPAAGAARALLFVCALGSAVWTRARALHGCQVEGVGFFSLFAGTWLPFTGTCLGISRQQWGSFSDFWQLLHFCCKPPWEPPSSFALFLRCSLCARVLSHWAVFPGPAFPFKGMRLSGRHPSL